jgi:hypothetical protein
MTRSRRIIGRLLPAFLVTVAVLVAATVAALLRIPSPWRYVWFTGMAVDVIVALGRLKKRRQRRAAGAGDAKATVKLGELLAGRDQETER